MGNSLTTMNSVLGYGFIILITNENHLIQIIKFIKQFNEENTTEINFFYHSCQLINLTDQILICFDKIQTVNNTVIKGNDLLNNQSILFTITDQEIEKLNQLGEILKAHKLINHYDLRWHIYDYMESKEL